MPRKSKDSRKRSKSAKHTVKKYSKPIKWSELVPKKKSSRKYMPEKCFLDKKNQKYPICPKRVNAITCKGIKSARARAVKNGDEEIVANADRYKDMCNKHLNPISMYRDANIISKSLRRTSRTNTDRRTRRKSRKDRMKKEKYKDPDLHHLSLVGLQIKHKNSKKKKRNSIDF